MKKFILFTTLLLAISAIPIQAQTPPCPTGKTCSGGVTFTVTFPNPTAPASVTPAQVVAGSSSTTITLTAASGSAFNAQMTVEACQVTPTPCSTQTDLATTFVSSTSITAVLPVALLANSGTITLYISQPSNAHATNLQWKAPGTDSTHGAATTYYVYRSGTAGGPSADPTSSSTPRV